MFEQVRGWADKGKAWAQSQLGSAFQFGVGVKQSYEKAFEYYTLAIQQSDASAMFGLADMYYHGQGVTKSINKMVDIAQRDKDHNTFTFLQFFVNEQIEEEQQFENILQKFNLLGRDKLAIYEIDKLLSEMANSTTTESQN